MKTPKVITSLLLVGTILTGGYAQSEYDDMYFTGKDREKQVIKKEEVYAYNSNYSKKKKATQTEYVNPTDSYSARNLNPEYVARTKAKEGLASDEYFASNYQYVNPTVNNLNSFNTGFNSWYGNSWYNAGYFSPYINSWNSPYYNPYYDPYYSSFRNPNPWADPYYRSGWSSSFSYFWGSSWNYGWGMGTGFGFGNPYYNNAWCPSYGYNNYGYYPTTVVVVNNSIDNSPSYGKRGSRSSATTHSGTTSTRNRSTYVADVNKGNYGGGRTTSTGRSVSSTSSSTSQDAYYNRSWRRDAQNASSSYGYSNRSYNNSGTYSSGTNSRSSLNSGGTNSRSSSSFNSGGSSSRSSFNSGGSSGSSGGSRSSGGSSSGSSSSSGSRSSRGNN